MELSTRQENDILHISTQGSFTFNDNQQFRELIKEVESADIKTVKVDLSGVDFVDSAALGMLLLLRDIGEERQLKIELLGPQPQVQKMFTLSKFGTLFTIIPA